MSALAASALLVFGFAVFQVGFAQQCENQLILTSRTFISQQISSVLQRINVLEQRLNAFEDGSSPCHAGCSCADILRRNPSARSGDYWISDEEGVPQSVYCDMTRSCGGVTGGWTRVAYLDMTDGSQQCPSGLRQRTDSGVRTCAPHSDGAGCSGVIYSTGHIPYTRVCGRIHAYDAITNDGFQFHGRGGHQSLDRNYVDGISLTTNENPSQHIWTFAIRSSDCQCGTAPPFINGDYFCDGSPHNRVDTTNLLFLGPNCGRSNCCTFNNPPFFHQQFSEATSADIRMRLCRDQVRRDEDVLLQRVEIYVQ